jgi:membrane-bound ClpP family serine protease
MARGSGSLADGLRTIGVLGALLIAAFFVGQIMTVKPDRPESRVELADAVAGAKASATYDVVAPRALPTGWIATSTRFGPDAWHLGVLTDDNKYVGLEQAVSSPKTIVADFAPKSRAAGEVTIAGEPWMVRTEVDGDRIYVRDFGTTSVLVIGSATRAELERYLASLSAS